MERSESIKNLGAALLIVQRGMEAVSKSADNPYFNSKYADLNAVIGAVKELLNTNGIVALQPGGRDSEGSYVETTLIHTASGEWLTSKTYLVDEALKDMQKLGAAITYARRYGLQSLMLMEAEDDDGETAVGRGKTSSASKGGSRSNFTSRRAAETTAALSAASAPSSAGADESVTGTTTTTESVAPSMASKGSTFTRPSAFKNGSSSSNGKGVF